MLDLQSAKWFSAIARRYGQHLWMRHFLSVTLVVAFAGLLAILHVFEPQMNSGHLISEYQLTRHGWMMSLAFCSFGAGAMLVASAWQSRGLAVIGLALFVAGLFPPTPTKPVVAWTHGIAGVVTILGAPLVFVRVSWGGATRGLHLATLLAWVGLLAFVAMLVFAGHAAPDGTRPLHPAISVSNRLMVATYGLWFLIASRGPSRRQ